jgi:hypothetical protein
MPVRVFAITGADRLIPNFTSLADALTHTGPQDSAAERADLAG